MEKAGIKLKLKLGSTPEPPVQDMDPTDPPVASEEEEEVCSAKIISSPPVSVYSMKN